MMRWFRKLKLKFLNPPKEGDAYYSDSLFYVIANNIEKVMHGMRDKHGDAIWQVIPGDDTYRLTIESTMMPYYRCKAEVLATNVDFSQKKWLSRSQPRRISKEKFLDMILDGEIKKQVIL